MLMRTQRAADMVSGALLAGLGLLSLVASLNIAGVTGEHLHPRTLPYLLSLVIFVTGLALLLSGWRYRGEAKIIDWPGREGWKRILISLASIVVYLLLLEPLGFTLSSFLLLVFLTWYLGRYHIIFIILLGLATAVVIYFLFIQFLGLTFPVGPLGW
ncbi:Tripartite tricarboxylate transporter TctB family protein [Neomoorella glycerini]|uniref:Tripartite tricarboxylate transporter TctB family protein n=1 Tax=Neomoorella glycerini TaxID=55779 RepID=A0A6I5ZSR1_9FIRM|nr:tripartite tricarboxylate transporter TctB family protein [Moorella glycerini]QGP92910.1 Tripartite tricarboxylate transporter TctB family protein [Moorella glycerini]